jgi:hypothetical protein
MGGGDGNQRELALAAFSLVAIVVLALMVLFVLTEENRSEQAIDTLLWLGTALAIAAVILGSFGRQVLRCIQAFVCCAPLRWYSVSSDSSGWWRSSFLRSSSAMTPPYESLPISVHLRQQAEHHCPCCLVLL